MLWSFLTFFFLFIRSRASFAELANSIPPTVTAADGADVDEELVVLDADDALG